MEYRSFREMLTSATGFVVQQNRALLRRILKEHAPDDARQMLGKKVVDHLELSGFEIYESGQTNLAC